MTDSSLLIGKSLGISLHFGNLTKIVKTRMRLARLDTASISQARLDWRSVDRQAQK